MARVKIKDLPKGMKVSREEMRKISGGFELAVRRSNIASTSPPLTFNISGMTPVFQNWVPQEMAGCACMGMGQNPKTEMLPG